MHPSHLDLPPTNTARHTRRHSAHGIHTTLTRLKSTAEATATA
jgi:hypothetical protein